MNVYQIEPPDDEGARRIALSIYGEIRSSHDWGRAFPDAPSSTVLDLLGSFAPREMRRVILNAFGNAKLAGRAEIREQDVNAERIQRRQRIGF